MSKRFFTLNGTRYPLRGRGFLKRRQGFRIEDMARMAFNRHHWVITDIRVTINGTFIEDMDDFDIWVELRHGDDVKLEIFDGNDLPYAALSA